MSKYTELAKKWLKIAQTCDNKQAQKNANEMLAKYMEKHNISMSDLEIDTVNEYKIVAKKHTVKLLSQIFYAVWGAKNKDMWELYETGSNCVAIFNCTAVDYAEISLQWELYSDSLERQLSSFIDGFIVKNNIFPNESFAEAELSENDLERSKKAKQMAKVIDKTDIRKRLSK